MAHGLLTETFRPKSRQAGFTSVIVAEAATLNTAITKGAKATKRRKVD